MGGRCSWARNTLASWFSESHLQSGAVAPAHQAAIGPGRPGPTAWRLSLGLFLHGSGGGGR